MSTEKPHLSIIIVAYKNMDSIVRCLASIPPLPWIEVIIVDNTRHNRGFGKGCNVGATLARGEFLLFSNPDTEVSEKALETMMEIISKDTSIGVLGPKLATYDGKEYLSCSERPTRITAPIIYSFLNKVWRQSKIVRKFWFDHQPPKQQTDVGSVSGAVMLMRKSVFDTVHGFDEKFFLYFEEADLEWRISDLGWRIVFEPAATMIHQGETSTLEPRPQVLKWFKESRYYYFKKHFGTLYAIGIETWLTAAEEWRWVVTTLILIGIAWFRMEPGFYYWWGVVGAIGLTTAFYNELQSVNKNIKLVLSGLVGLIPLFLSPIGAVVGLLGSGMWVLTDLMDWKSWRKILVYSWMIILVGMALHR